MWSRHTMYWVTVMFFTDQYEISLEIFHYQAIKIHRRTDYVVQWRSITLHVLGLGFDLCHHMILQVLLGSYYKHIARSSLKFRYDSLSSPKRKKNQKETHLRRSFYRAGNIQCSQIIVKGKKKNNRNQRRVQ